MLGATALSAMTGGAMLRRAEAAEANDGPVKHEDHGDKDDRYTPVVTVDGSTMPFKIVDGVKEFRIVAEPIEQEFAPGMKVKCWGYNGSTPGPTIEAVEGDRVRLFVTNKLGEHTTIHWHGLLLPCGMDGVGGLNQPQIEPGETWVYEFTLRQHGTQMYHPHADEMTQMAFGMMGMFIIHPKKPERKVDRDYAIMLHEWMVPPGAYRPDPNVMLDFNTFTFNGRVFPGTSPLLAQLGERVRVRFGNLSMDQHPIHLHGYQFKVTGTDAGPIPETAQWPMTTVPVPVGATRDFELVADAPGDWIMHCHKSHHTMNAMGHDVPNMIGVDQREGDLEKKLRALLPGYMAMGQQGMAEHQDHARHMKGPANTLPMMSGEGPYGNLEMGGMFTMLKVRDQLPRDGGDPGWYEYPKGTQAWKVDG
ncbi:MAG: multicopper oxidase domain-containing protein [Planctomycetes bacterium]|nr:multicopper oxidase domain-containing protein [Planctomycetota bacterium]